jgi:hypothetical protein
MGALTASVLSLGSGGEAALLAAVGAIASALSGALSWARAARRKREAEGEVADLGLAADFAAGAGGGLEEGAWPEERGDVLSRRSAARERRMHERPLSADIMRTVIREELAIAIDVLREEIKRSGQRAFWSGFGQGLLFYVCGVGATLIIKG